MGYNTYYSLNIVGLRAQEAFEQLKVVCDDFFMEDEQVEPENVSASGTCKWYDVETDLCALSKEFPELKITLYAEGEENGDEWKVWFLAGDSHKYQAEWSPPGDDQTFAMLASRTVTAGQEAERPVREQKLLG